MTSSTGRDSRGAVLLAILVALATALAMLPGASLGAVLGAAGQEPAPPVIGSIVVQVDGRPVTGPLRDIVPLKPGDVYSPVSVDQAVRQIYQVGLFSDIRVLKSGQEKVDLTFVLTRNVTVRKIKVDGAKVRTSRLREAMETLRAGSVFDEDKLPKAVEELKEALRKAGYFGAAVEASVRRRPAEPRVDIVFTVTGAKRFRVRGVDLAGTLAVARGEIFRRMKTRPPKFYEPALVDRDIQTLSAYYADIGYRRAEVALAGEKFDEAAGTVLLEIGIQPHEKISIITNGAKVPGKLLAPIWEERIFEEWGLSEGEVRVLSYLRKKGYLFATVKSRIERPENEIRVIYDIDPGHTYRIDRVSFEGLSAFTEQRLKEELVVSENVLFFALLSYDRLFALPSEIEYFYQTNGFPDVRVKLELRRSREKGVDAVYTVEEGSRRRIASIAVNGSRLFPVKDILAGTLGYPGGPYFAPAIQRDIGIIESFYLNHGVRGTRVTSRADPQTDGLYAVTYDIEEGRPVVIRNILITGNRTTRPRVIGREIQVRVGEPADAAKIQDSRRRLERLGIFSDVRTDEVMTGEGGEILVVAVQEGEANYAGVGVGLESKNPVPSAGANTIKPRATAEYIRSNVLGLAAQLSFIGQTSLIEKRAIVSWSQPYLFGITLQPALLGWIEQEDRTSFGFDRRGVSFNLSRPLGRNVFLLGTLSLSRTKLTFIDFAPSDVDRRLQPYASALASVSLILDRRDDSFNPTRGWFFSVVAQGAQPIFGTESDYWKTFFKFQRLWPVIPRLNVTMTARVGLSQGKIAVPERFFAGGSNSFRGQQFDYLGPKDPDTGKPVGGKALFLLNVEVPFPIFASFKDLSGVVFGDVGNVYPEIRDFRLRDLETAAGLGLRYRTPLGPVRIELAWRLGAPERRGRPLLFITIGNVF